MVGMHNLPAKLALIFKKNNAGTTVFVLFGVFTKNTWERGHITCVMLVCSSSCMHVTNWEPR